MDREVLKQRMTERFEELFAQAVDAVERAPDGQWIAASEFPFRDAFQQLLKECHEAAIQAKMDERPAAPQAAFSPSGPNGGGATAVERQGAQDHPTDHRGG